MNESTMEANTVQADTALFLMELGKPLAKAKTIKETLDNLMHQIGKVFEPLHWSLLLKDFKTGELRFTTVVGSCAAQLKGMSLRKGEGVAGWIAESGRSLIIEDARKDPRFSPRMDTLMGFTTRSIIGVPLKTNQKIFGVIELINRLNDGAFREMDLRILEAIGEYGAIAIERAYYNQALKKMALHDPLTGLKSKAAFESRLRREVASSREQDQALSLLLIRIEGLQAVNEAHGREAVELVLKDLAEVLTRCLRDTDGLFRTGADSFIALLKEADQQTAEVVRNRILHFLERPSRKPVSYHVLISIKSASGAQSASLLQMIQENAGRPALSDISRGNRDLCEGLQPMLNEEMQAAGATPRGARPPYTKQVSLPGKLVLVKSGTSTSCTVTGLSLKGLQCRFPGRRNIRPDDTVQISFLLDDRRKSPIERKAIVRHAEGNTADMEFYNPPPYDKELGFYLMV
jgi:diguanylate cyclase (GGDEF)-like protein